MWRLPARPIPSLDGLRAVSILLVLVGHAANSQGFPGPNETQHALGPLGELGVRIFFVISGYLITTLLLEEWSRTGTISLRWFYFRRALRIFPPFYAFLAVLALLNGAGVLVAPGSLPPGSFLLAATYTSNYFGLFWYLEHTWSLSVEEQFYLLWPAVLLVAGPRRAGGLAAGTLVLFPMVRIVYHFVPGTVTPEYHFEAIGDTIAAGCLLALGRDRLTSPGWVRRFMESRWILLMLVLVLVGWVAQVRPRLGPVFFLSGSLMNLGIVACVGWCLTHTGGRIARFLNWPPVVTLGVLSYSVYLWQQVFLPPGSSGFTFPGNLLPIIPVAMASYLLVEQPALRLRRWLEQRLRTRRAAARPEGLVLPVSDRDHGWMRVRSAVKDRQGTNSSIG
jgi:peptidoglycan/LPS O-acetylase OafA/YrhL